MEYKEIQELRSHRDNLLISVAHTKIMLTEGCMNFIDREMKLHGEYDGTMWKIKVRKKKLWSLMLRQEIWMIWKWLVL